jgi:hypothetical protein
MDEVLTLALESPLIALVSGENDVLSTVPPPAEISSGQAARQ